jgi:hypothetical protein
MERRAESYGGLVPSYFNFGSAEAHFLSSEVPLLGCECGEWGCWPLLAKIVVTADEVRWTDFQQPHRPKRDYSGFGPFGFRRADYEAAVRAIAPAWDLTRAAPQASGR